jgi:hypothetical protein
MPSILDDSASPAKILLIGKSGAGKTGALASLVASDYNIRVIDTDNGVRALRSLLTDPRYKYADIIKSRGIDLNTAVRYVPIQTSMRLRTVTNKVGDKVTTNTILAPDDARAWTRAVDLLDKWKEGGIDLGSIRSWGPQDVLVLDSFSTLAKCAYYFSQSLNVRLGARDQGRDYQRDVGEAQSQLTRLLELLYDSDIKCNVIIISHITWVDESQGVASRPMEANQNDGIVSSPDGYPSAIGRALSPHMGKYFNDVFISRSSGSGLSVSRTISTVPSDGVVAKNSVWLNREYPVTTGLAEIFAALRAQPVPQDLLDVFKRQPAASATATTSQPNPVGQRPLASAQA